MPTEISLGNLKIHKVPNYTTWENNYNQTDGIGVNDLVIIPPSELKNGILPVQTVSDSGKFLTADGQGNTSWGSIPIAGTTASAISTTSSGGSATTWSKSDHVHNINSTTITTALGYTPYNSTNPNGYVTTDEKVGLQSITTNTDYQVMISTSSTTASKKWSDSGLTYLRNGSNESYLTIGSSSYKGFLALKNGSYKTYFVPTTLTANQTITIPNATGTLALTSNIPDITGKSDKVTNATNGNFASLDSNGNLADSGHKHSDYLTSHQDITGKADLTSDTVPKVVAIQTTAKNVSISSNTNLSTDHNGCRLKVTGPRTITIQNTLSEGFECEILNYGTGTVTITTSGTTINGSSSSITLSNKYDIVVLAALSTTEWVAKGDI